MLDTTVFLKGTLHCRKQIHVSIHNGDNHVSSFTKHYHCLILNWKHLKIGYIYMMSMKEFNRSPNQNAGSMP